MSRYDKVAAELKALAHPLRLAILTCVSADIQEPVVIWRHLVATEPDLQLALVAYHIKVLHSAGLIALARKEKAGNVDRHFYRLSVRGRHLAEVLRL